MKQIEKFNGKFYAELKPRYGSGLLASGTLLAKGLPELPIPIPVTTNHVQRLNTETSIRLDEVRKNKDMSFTGLGLCAIIIDTGVFEHEMLRGKIISWHTVNEDQHDVNDLHGHGTHMAGIIAAKPNDHSCMSIAPDARIISIKVTKNGSGSTSWANIHRALELALQFVQNPEKHTHGLRVGVINLSFNALDCNTSRKSHKCHKITEVIAKLNKSGVPVVVSSGNGFEYMKKDGLGYPAYLPGVIPVGATFNFAFSRLPANSLTTYSQRYEPEAPIDFLEPSVKKEIHGKIIYAPGACSISLANSNGSHKFTTASGTSVSAAIVSACILLLQEKSLRTRRTTLSVSEIFSLLMSGSERFRNVSHPPSAAGGISVANVYFDNKFYDCLNILNSLNTLI